MKLCFATNNEHKISEVQKLLPAGFQLECLNDIGCREELPETTGTIAGNSRQKAEHVNSHYHVDCFADDSGLEVEAIGNEPGVDSAYYAGPQRSHEDNTRLLLKKMEGIANRKARFITVITLITGAKTYQFEGVLNGSILHAPRGLGGFGYDPVFLPEGSQRSLAEMTLEEKNSISHRARAIRQLLDILESKG
jgi:XTP/dITP diphosphohydrolase